MSALVEPSKTENTNSPPLVLTIQVVILNGPSETLKK